MTEYLSLAPFKEALDMIWFTKSRNGLASRARGPLGRAFCSTNRKQRPVKAADVARCESFEEAGLRAKKSMKHSVNMGCNEAWFEVNVERSGSPDQPGEPESCTAEPCGGP